MDVCTPGSISRIDSCRLRNRVSSSRCSVRCTTDSITSWVISDCLDDCMVTTLYKVRNIYFLRILRLHPNQQRPDESLPDGSLLKRPPARQGNRSSRGARGHFSNPLDHRHKSRVLTLQQRRQGGTKILACAPFVHVVFTTAT